MKVALGRFVPSFPGFGLQPTDDADFMSLDQGMRLGLTDATDFDVEIHGAIQGLGGMVVIDGDVLKDLRRSEFVQYTVLNGRIYEAATMNEFGSKTKRQPFYFEGDNKMFMPAETKKEIEEKALNNHWVH